MYPHRGLEALHDEERGRGDADAVEPDDVAVWRGRPSEDVRGGGAARRMGNGCHIDPSAMSVKVTNVGFRVPFAWGGNGPDGGRSFGRGFGTLSAGGAFAYSWVWSLTN